MRRPRERQAPKTFPRYRQFRQATSRWSANRNPRSRHTVGFAAVANDHRRFRDIDDSDSGQKAINTLEVHPTACRPQSPAICQPVSSLRKSHYADVGSIAK